MSCIGTSTLYFLQCILYSVEIVFVRAGPTRGRLYHKFTDRPFYNEYMYCTIVIVIVIVLLLPPAVTQSVLHDRELTSIQLFTAGGREYVPLA
jgi:hypothetical protein